MGLFTVPGHVSKIVMDSKNSERKNRDTGNIAVCDVQDFLIRVEGGNNEIKLIKYSGVFSRFRDIDNMNLKIVHRY